MSSKYVLAGIALGATAFAWVIQCLGILQILEWAVLDYGFRRRPTDAYVPPVAIITIDDDTIAASGRWPISDQMLGQLLTQVKSYDPVVIGLDLYRDLPIEPGHRQLEQVFRTTPNLIGIKKAVGERSSPAVPPPPVLEALGRVSFNDLVLDNDGHVRRHLLSLRQDEHTKLALGTRLALMYLEQQAGIIPESLENQRMRLGKAEFTPLRGHAGGYVRADTGGYQILANYLIPSQGIPTVSMQAVLNDQVPADLLSQKVVLVGLKAESSWGDLFYTPYSLNSDQSWAGVEIHANLAAQLIASALEGRAPLRPLPELVEWLWVLFWSGVSVVTNRKLSHSVWDWLCLMGLATFLLAATYLIFLNYYWMPLIPALIGFGSSWVVTQNYLIQHRLQREKQILEQTVSARTQALRQQNQALAQARVQAELANQAKSKFIAHISHELRTPLTAILGFGNLLENSVNLPAHERDYAETISQCGEHLLSLINNVLELSKIETGSLTLTVESVNLPMLLSDLQQMFQAQVVAKQLDLQITLADAVPQWIETDGGKLRQIIINLLGNAIKFTEVGHIRLSVHKVCAAEAQDTLTFMVEDTGIGLMPDEIKQLFRPFVQTASGKSLGKGTGLGLALSRQYVELLNGTIEASSTYGQGSQFSFHIPLRPMALSENFSTMPSLTDHRSLAEVPKDYRIMVVDDEANNRRLLSQWLADAQLTVQTTGSGEEALKIFEQWRPHLVLLDIHLPDIDGYEVARQIREVWESQSQSDLDRWENQEEPVILAITAGVLQDNVADLLAAGCDDVLWKPIKFETLSSKIVEYCL